MIAARGVGTAMPTYEVSALDDPRLRPFAELPARAQGSTIVVEGAIAVARALASEHPVRAVLLTPSHHARLGGAIDEGVEVLEADAALVRQVVGFDFHRGCVAVMDRPPTPSTEALVARVRAWPAGPRRIVLVAEGLADPANLGAVIRNARAFGVDLVLHGGGADPWSRRGIRAAMGHGFSLPVVGCEDLPGTVAAVKQGLGSGTRTVAAVVQPGAVPLPSHRASERVVLLVGNEGAGLSEPLRALADEAVVIPLAAGVDSLNVAAATAVLLWVLRG